MKVWTTKDVGEEYNFTEEEKQEIADYVNEKGYNVPMNPTPVQVRFFGVPHGGYFYFYDENHSGHMYITEEGATKYNFKGDETLANIYETFQEDLDEINEDRGDKPWVYYFDISQFWSVYDSDGIEVPETEWKNLPIDCQPYEEEFVIAINGIPPALLDDEENCFIGGWCDG